MKIDITLDLAPAQLEAFKRDCRLNSIGRNEVNGVDLRHVYRAIEEQLSERPSDFLPHCPNCGSDWPEDMGKRTCGKCGAQKVRFIG